MEIYELRYFLAVAESENMQRAAKAIHVSPPSLSKAIARLEEELDLTRRTVEESRSRYANGLDSYLSVLTALTQAQGLERRLISERRRLLSLRAQLYRALGGAEWTPLLEPAPEIPFEDMKSVAVERGDDPDQGANR